MRSISFIILVVIVGLIACSNHPGAKHEFEVLEFHQDSIPKQCTYIGEVLGGARWWDANGENILIVSQNFKTGVDAGIQELFAYTYILDNSKSRLLWKWYDENENICDMGEGLVSKIEIDDVDADGIGESAFIYSVEGACVLSPRLFTLVFHSDTTSLTINGTKRVQVDEHTILGGDIITDSTFGSTPIVFGDFCMSLWERTLE